MISVIHAIAWFPPEVEPKIFQLMRDQSSCARLAYQAIHKYGLKSKKNVYWHLKSRFGNKLKAIQIYDAYERIKNIKKPGVIFGGKKNWYAYVNGKISK